MKTPFDGYENLLESQVDHHKGKSLAACLVMPVRCNTEEAERLKVYVPNKIHYSGDRRTLMNKASMPAVPAMKFQMWWAFGPWRNDMNIIFSDHNVVETFAVIDVAFFQCNC